VEFRRGLCRVVTVCQTADHGPEEAIAFPYFNRQTTPEIRPRRKAEARRHHTDESVRVIVQFDDPAANVGVRVKTAAPESVAEYDDTIFFRRQERSSEHGLNAKNRKEPGCYLYGAD